MPTQQIYFPAGVAVGLRTTGEDCAGHAPGRCPHKYLFVANSDFDLQFDGGSVQSFDLAALERVLPKLTADGVECGPEGERPAADRALFPGRCNSVDPLRPPGGGPPLLVDSVAIGAFASNVIFRARPRWQPFPETFAEAYDDEATPGVGEPVKGRLFIPVRGDGTLHWLDVHADGHLDCGQAGNNGACDAAHRAGDDPASENLRGMGMPRQPYSIAASRDGRVILVPNEVNGFASVFSHRWWNNENDDGSRTADVTDPNAPGEASGVGPQLKFVLAGLADLPAGVASLPKPAVVDAKGLTGNDYFPGFLLSYGFGTRVDLVRYFGDVDSSPPRPFLFAAGAVNLQINRAGRDSRGVAIDDTLRRAEERACAARYPLASFDERDPLRAAYNDCVTKAAAFPLGVYVSTRSPAALLIGRTRSAVGAEATDDLPVFRASVPLATGASRVYMGSVVVNAQGDKEPRVFAVCFDARRIFVYDPIRDRMETEIVTGRGPHGFVVDEERGLGYIGHFTDSFVGVVNLKRHFSSSYGKIIATLGIPVAPRSAK